MKGITEQSLKTRIERLSASDIVRLRSVLSDVLDCFDQWEKNAYDEYIEDDIATLRGKIQDVWRSL